MDRLRSGSRILRKVVTAQASTDLNLALGASLHNGLKTIEKTSDYGSTCSQLSLESLSIHSDEDEEFSKLRSGPISWDCLRDTRNKRVLKYQNITVIIPDHNLSGYQRDEFFLEILTDPVCVPNGNDVVNISQVICVGPHGTRFDSNTPAFIWLPIEDVKPARFQRIQCLSSNTPVGDIPRWEEITKEHYHVKGHFVVIRAFHFSLFTVVLRTNFPEESLLIDGHGGTITVPEVPGVRLKFPNVFVCPGFTAYCKVLFEKEPFEVDGETKCRGLASPIIMVGPSGMNFVDPVIVSLPIPYYRDIVQKYGSKRAKLFVWRSTTLCNGQLVWVKLDVQLSFSNRHGSGEVVISFPVYHFSFFKAVWDILASSLTNARLSLSYFYPVSSFSMMCQASMEENKDDRSFALEVILYHSNKAAPEASNYPYKVGASLKPNHVRPGAIRIKLKSELFEADPEAGEEESLTKTEENFRGREFEKQFVCRYKEGKGIRERGTIGKVIVERIARGHQPELIFEFNLHKRGHEAELKSSDDNLTDWSLTAVKQLAETLNLLEDANWKKLAYDLGFTKSEISTKLSCSVDPFQTIVVLYKDRGGTPEEFIQRMHEVSARLGAKGSRNTSPCSSRRGTPTSNKSDNSELGFSPPKNEYPSPNKWREPDDSESISTVATGSTNLSSASSRKRFTSAVKNHQRLKRRRKEYLAPRRHHSEYSETVSSSEESNSESTLNKALSMRRLVDSDMWSISYLMNTMNWRALGRTLGLEESVLLNIEHAYKATGFRECAYQMLLEWKGRKPLQCTYGTLYSALCKEKMISIAKGMSKLKLGEEETDATLEDL